MTRKNWTKDELILALDIYFKIPYSRIGKKNSLVQNLASIIGRSPSAVALKLANFAHLDPTFKDKNLKGLSNGSKEDKLV